MQETKTKIMFEVLRKYVVLASMAFVALAGALAVLPDKAKATWSDGKNYIIHPAVDGHGSGTGHLEFLINNPAKVYGAGNTAPAYMPEQYLIVTNNPNYNFEIRGGRFAPGQEPYDGSIIGAGNRVYYEVYQLPNAGSRSGALVNRVDASTLPGGVDISGGTNNSCSGGPCWQTIAGGAADGSNETGRFKDPRYPNLNGHFVFLFKVVAANDGFQGYVSDIDRVLTSNDGNLGCPVAANLNCADTRGSGNPGDQVVANGYFLRAPAGYMIATAPSNISFGFRAGLNGQGGDYPGTYAFGFPSAGSVCSPDWGRVPNIDWDYPNSVSGDATISADVFQGGVGSRPVPTFPINEISGDWLNAFIGFNYPNTIHLNGPPFNWSNQGGRGALLARGFNLDNFLYQGGTPFTWDEWPGCANGGSVSRITPRPIASGYLYNGRNSYTILPGNRVDTRLSFSFNVSLGGNGSNVPIPVKTWVEIDGQRHGESWDYVVSGTTFNKAPEVQVGDGYYNWIACFEATGTRICSQSPWRIHVNEGPRATNISAANPQDVWPLNTLNVNYACDFLTFSVADGTNPTQVSPTVFVNWSGPGGAGSAQTNPGPRRNSGSTWTSDDLVMPSGKTLTRYLREDIPDNVDVRWSTRAFDMIDASDGPSFYNGFLRQPPVPLTDFNQPPVDKFRWGPETVTTYHKNSRPTFNQRPLTTKQFYDLANNPITSVTDGQTIKVETKVQNAGQTPAKYYEIIDYLGALRDFEQPNANTITVQKNTNPAQSPRNPDGSPKVTAQSVLVNDQNNPAGDSILGGSPSLAEQRQGAWKLNYGNNQQPAPVLPSDYMYPGDYVLLSYYVRANRNQNLVNPDSVNADYSRSIQPGDDHIYVQFQEDFCTNSDRVIQTIDPNPGQVFAPWLRAGRGSVHSNATIWGYDSFGGDVNATFTITANGAISHFTSAQGTAYQNYTNPKQACTAQQTGGGKAETTGGIDWRRQMIDNTNRAKRGEFGPVKTVPGATFNLNTLDGGNLNGVYTTNGPQNLTITGGTVTGKGTIIVNGDLNITGNFTYGPDTTGINSLGIIVLGNLTVAPNVTNIVGSYFVLDVLNKGQAQIDPANGCPLISDLNGRVDTGYSSAQLVINGLMVANRFNFQRYYVNGDNTQSDPAENVFYDGRVVANTPPGFATFRNTTAWYEIAP